MIKIAKNFAFSKDIKECERGSFRHILIILYGIVYKHIPDNCDKNIFDLKCESMDISEEEKDFYKGIEELYINDIMKNEQYKKNPTNNIDICMKNVQVGLDQLTAIDNFLEIISDKHIQEERVKKIIKDSIYEERNLNLLLYNIDKKDDTVLSADDDENPQNSGVHTP